MEDDLEKKYKKMEDNLKKIGRRPQPKKNGRQPQIKNGRQPQKRMEDDLKQKWKKTSTKKYIWKTTLKKIGRRPQNK